MTILTLLVHLKSHSSSFRTPVKILHKSPSHIDHHCCYGCLDGIFCRRCTCKSCGNGAHIGYKFPPKVPIISTLEPCHNQNVDEFPQTLTSFHPTYYSGDENSFAHDSIPNFINDSPNVFNPPPQPLTYSYEFCRNDAHYSHDCPPQVPFIYNSEPRYNQDFNFPQNFQNVQQQYPCCESCGGPHENFQCQQLAEYINTPNWNRPAFSNYDDDDDEDYTIAITPEEPDNSLSMGDEHLDTILEMESDEVIKSSVEDLVPIPSESEEEVKDDILREKLLNIHLLVAKIESLNDNVEASPPDSKLVSLEEVKDDILREKLLNIHLLVAKIESLNDNPTLDHISLPKFETFSDHTKETSSGSTTTHADYSLPKYDSFLFEIEPDQGELTSVVMEDNLGEPRVHVPNVLPTHPTFMLDSYFIPSDNSLPESEIFYFDIEEKDSGSTTIHDDTSLSNLECFNIKSKLDLRVDSGIYENVLPITNVNLSPEDEQSPLFAYVVWIFLFFLTYPVVPLYLLSSRNEDTIFDPDISNYHFSSLLPGVSHRSGTFMKFNVYQNT
nr:hypothetical protein [Tanacetum cinerariifolium]